MPKTLLFVLLSLSLAACLPMIATSTEASLERGETLFRDDFETSNNWDTRNEAGLFIGIEDSAYTIFLAQAGRYAWGLNNTSHEAIILETSIQFRSSYPRTFAGLMCRASNEGRGYYFLISADGAFSIRRGAQNDLGALIEWQNNKTIFTDGRPNILQAICAGDYLALYVNEQFLGSVQDDTYRSGYTGLLLGLPPTAGVDNPANVQFEYIEAWQIAN